MTAQLQGPANYDLDPGLCHSPQKQCHQNTFLFSTRLPHHRQLQVYTPGVKLEAELIIKKYYFWLVSERSLKQLIFISFYFPQPSRKNNHFNFWLVNYQLLFPFILPLSHYFHSQNEMFVYQSTFHYQSNTNYISLSIGI